MLRNQQPLPSPSAIVATPYTPLSSPDDPTGGAGESNMPISTQTKEEPVDGAAEPMVLNAEPELRSAMS